MNRSLNFLITGILFFLSSFRMGNSILFGENQQNLDWNTYTVKEISFSLPDSYQFVEPDNELIAEMDDIDTLLFMAYDANPDTEDFSVFMVGERYKPEYFDFQAYVLELENQYDEIYNTEVSEKSLFGEIQSAVIYAKDYTDEPDWFIEQTYLLSTNVNLYQIRFILFTQNQYTEIPFLNEIFSTIKVTPEAKDEESFNPICVIGLCLFLILFGLNIWMRRKKKNAIVMPEDVLKK